MSIFSYVSLRDPKRPLCTILPQPAPGPRTLFLTNWKKQLQSPTPQPGVAVSPDAPEVCFSPEATVLSTLGGNK